MALKGPLKTHVSVQAMAAALGALIPQKNPLELGVPHFHHDFHKPIHTWT